MVAEIREVAMEMGKESGRESASEVKTPREGP